MKKAFAVILSVLMIASLCACGSSYSAGASAKPIAPSYNSAGVVTDSAASEEWYYDGGYEMESPAEPNPGMGSETSVFPEGTKMVYTANIDMQTTEFDKALETLRALVTDCRGYFENSSVNNYGSYRNGNYTIRVPAENYRSFVDTVGEGCLRTYFNENADDISETYYDTQSRLETQRTKLERLQALLAQAENMEDIITLESAISDTEWQIERLAGTMRHYDSMVGYSTVYINVSEVYKLANVEEPVVGFGAKLSAAFKNGCQNFVDNVQDLLISLAYGWVTLLMFIVIVVVIVIICVKVHRKNKRTKLERIAAYQLAQQKAEETKENDNT